MSYVPVGCIFRETASASFPISSFSWRGLVVAGLPGWRGTAAVSVPDTARDGRSFAGGFRYRDSALVSSTLCRNRFIFWQCRGSSLYLLEVSLDTSLAHAALRVDVKDGSVLVPEVNVQEVEGRNVVVLFATTSAVFRLLLLHPEAISKDPTLSSAGAGLQPSVFASAQPDSLQGSNMAALFSQHSSAQPISMVTGWITLEGLTTFALASPSGSIHLIQLPSPQAHGLPVRSELKQSSVIHRLWASFIPAAIRGGGDADDAPVSLAIHSFGRNIIVLALCRDIHLRLWSTEPPECIMSCDLEEYILQELEHNISATKLLLRKAAGGTSSSLRFAVYIETSSGSQVSLFQLLAVDRQLHLDHIHSCPCKNDAELVDFQATNSAVWGVWKGEEGETVLQHTTYDGESCHVWQSAHVSSPPPRDISVTQTSEPRSVFLEALLYPGRFSTSAIDKALELYGCNPAKESMQELRKEATIKVEQELLSSAGSTKLVHEEFRELQIKCWTKFYGCCYQYHQLMSQPLGVFQDPSTGLVCLFKEGMLSFVYPATRADCLALEGHLSSDNLPADDIARFMEAMKITRNQLSTEAVDALLSTTEPVTIANELAVAIVDQPANESVLTVVKERLSGISCLSDVLRGVAESMDPTSHCSSLDSSGEDLPDTDLQLALSQLFSSPLCENILVASLRETCLTRMALARDILIVLCLIQHNKFQAVDHTHMAQFVSLLQNYRCLYWLCCRPTLPASPSSLESNLRQLAALNISTSSRGPPSTTEGSVLELYLRSVGGSQLRSALLRTGQLSSGVHLCSLWTSLLPESINILIAQLWPCTNSVAVCQFLLSTCQYTHLQDYVTQVAPLVHEGQYSLHFLVGQSYLTTGELDKAEDHFVRAAGGLGDDSENLLKCIIRGKGESGEGRVEAEEEEEGDEREEGEEDVEEERGEREEGGRRRLRYYLRVMRLFEQVPSPLAVVNMAEIAVKDMDGEDPLCVVVWSALFKYHLELGHYESAYKAMMANPDAVRRKECLRHFVVILTELQQLKLLCHLTYPGMEEEIERVIEERARSVDVVKHKYYDLLYCFHTTRQNYRKAASVMYEYGLRLGREAPGPKSLQKQANCFCMCLTALHLAEPQYAWVVVPVELEEILAQNTKKSLSRKRAHPSHQAPQQQVEVRTIPDIEKEYALAKTKLSLLRREPSMATQICSPFVSPEEVIARLVQVGLFDKAVDTALQFDLPLDSVFEALASRCVHLSMNVVTFREGAGDVSNWNWLGMNESMDAPTPTEKTIADKAWQMLKTYLETYDSSFNYQLQKCVARKLLSLGSNLPQWMVKRYKETNPAELLRLYLNFDLLEEATYLALEYIDAVLGPQKKDFAMKTTLHASSPSVWLPYSALDHLQIALQGAQRETSLAELSSQLSSKLEDYFCTVSSVTSDKEHHVQQRMMATH